MSTPRAGAVCGADRGGFLPAAAGTGLRLPRLHERRATDGRKILTLLDTPEPVWGGEAPDGLTVSMRRVSFSCDANREILRDVSPEHCGP